MSFLGWNLNSQGLFHPKLEIKLQHKPVQMGARVGVTQLPSWGLLSAIR